MGPPDAKGGIASGPAREALSSAVREEIQGPRRAARSANSQAYFLTNFCRQPPDGLASQPLVRPA